MMKCISKIIAAVVLFSLINGAHAVVILQYHHISEKTPPSTSITPALFRWHMQHLSDANYSVLSLPQVVSALRAGKTLPDKSVVITFDDGYDSVFKQAYPVLKEKGWPFTVFVNTRPLENGIGGFTTWDQLNEMAKHGATIANHSHTHTHFLRRLDNESDNQWRVRIRADIQTAEELIQQRTGQQHKLLAYPYGEYDNAVKNIVSALGFTAFGQQSGPIGDPAHSPLDFIALPRFPFGGIYGDKDDFKIKAATLAMPIKSAKVLTKANGSELADTILPQNSLQPLLQIIFSETLTAPVQCFASGQGAISVDQQETGIVTSPKRALPVGRSRINCTAASQQPGRFYWYSHFFIRKQTDGGWYPEL